MAQNISLMGASYSDVPSVQLPKTGGGTASFTDTSPTTAAAADVASGKYFFTANGVLTLGTSTGGGTEAGTVTQDENGFLVLDDDAPSGRVTVEALSVTQNGTYTAPTGKAYSPVTVSVSGGGSADLKAIIEGTAVTPTLPSDLTSIRGYAFYGLTTLAITSLPSGIEGIGTYAFYNCSNLALTALPDTYYLLGTYAFYGCTNMPLASLGSLFASGIPSNGFNGCKAITALDCANASSIAANGFANCNALQTLVLRRTTVVTLANVSAFLNTPLRGYNSQTATVYVPSDLVDSYKTASNWKTIYDAGSLTFSSIEGSAYEL